MTTVEIPHQQFRLSMLLYDTRYRSLTIQVVAVLVFMLAAAWLVNNTVQNLAALGKDFSFGFLGARAGYDISQTLIPYTNDSTHARAALVGIVNTLLVAVVGCMLATVIGVLHGRAAAVQQLDRRPAGRGLRRRLPQHPGAALDPRDHGDHHRHGAGADGLPRRQRHRLDALRLGRGHQPRALRPLAGVRTRLAGRGRHLHRCR